jgi:predicted dehydrogenase
MLNRREALEWIGGAVAGSILTSTACAKDESSTSRPRIKIGQIGMGHAHAAVTLAAFRASDDYEVVGIVEPDETFRKSAGSHRAYQGLPRMTQGDLLSVPGLQGVLVETRVRNLLDAAEACVNAGKHIHLDKPAGDSLAQFKRILESAARQRLHVQMGYVFRYNPAVVLLRELLEKKWLGEVFEVHAVMSKQVPEEQRKLLAEYHGGILFELGGHVIDLIVNMLGQPDKIVSSIQHVSPLNDGLDDNTLAVFTYPRAIATVKCSGVEVEGNKRRQFTVCGTEGTLHIQPLDNPVAQLTLSKPRGSYKAGTQVIEFPPAKRYVNEAAEMARVIRGEKSARFTYEHDLAVQSTLLQACQVPLDR